MPETTKARATWDELQAEIRELRDRVDHLTAMRDEDLQAGQALEDRVARCETRATDKDAHRELEARVARCEARLDGRGDEVPHENNPPEVLTEDDALKPVSPEDTEGLEPVAKMRRALMGSRQIEDVRRVFEEDPRNPWEPLVRLSDAVEKIRGMRETFSLLWDRHDRLTARLESVERERDALRQRLEGMVGVVDRQRLEEALSVWDQQGIRTVDDFAGYLGLTLTGEADG